MDALTTSGSVLGVLFGTAGLTISILNYLRDRTKVRVTLSWNMTDIRTGKMSGLVKATNTGRRAVFISIAGISLPGDGLGILGESIAGAKLNEGDKPAAYLVAHNGFAEHAKQWRKIRAFVEDSTGKRYYSKYPAKNDDPPNWAVPAKGSKGRG